MVKGTVQTIQGLELIVRGKLFGYFFNFLWEHQTICDKGKI
jgi:hypothetical protein